MSINTSRGLVPKDNYVFLYTLSHPITGEIRYVGKTTQTLNCRLASHYCRDRPGVNHLNKNEAWVKSLKNQGLKPNIELLDEVKVEEWEEEEKFYISYFSYLGIRLTNLSKGGDTSNYGSRWKVNPNLIQNNPRSKKPVFQFSPNGKFIKQWESAADFSRFYGLVKGAASKAIVTHSLCAGYILIKEEDYNDENFLFNKRRIMRKTKVDLYINKQYVKTFDNVKQASEELNVSNSSICYCLRGKLFAVKGYSFKHSDK